MTAETKTKQYWGGVGRRKSAVASIRIYEGAPSIIINKKEATLPDEILAPFELVGKKGSFSITAKVLGGGKEGQLTAIRHGIARALEKYNTEFRSTLKKAGFLTRDPREKERKKPGLKGARRAPQWAKR
jgi:small subunit ribosomal protein S9